MPHKTSYKTLSAQELAVFFDSIAMLMRAGIIAGEAPGIIAADMENGRLQKACVQLDSLLSTGQECTVSGAMATSGVFTAYSIEMMRLGEISGRMDTTSQLLSSFYRRQDIVGENVKGAIIGPLLLLLLMSVVLLFLVFRVMPVFESVFESLGAVAGGNMAVAVLVSRVSLAAVGMLLLGIVIGAALFFIPATRNFALAVGKIFPPIRRIEYYFSASNFTQGLSMLLASGISGSEALGKTAGLVRNANISKHLPACQKMVESGEDIGKALVESGVLTGFEAKVLLSAARAGQTDLVMGRLAAHYAQQADAQLESLLAIIEPALVGVLSVAIGIILLSIMLPLTGIMSTIQ